MQITLRVMGGLGLVLCILVLIATSYAAVRVDETVKDVIREATAGLATVKERAADARRNLEELTDEDRPLADDELEEQTARRLERVEQLEEMLAGIDERIESVNVGLEKALTVLSFIGSDVNGQRLQAGLQRLKAIRSQASALLNRIRSATNRTRQDGPLKRTATRELATRSLTAAKEAFLPVGSLLDELDQVSDSAEKQLHQFQQRIHNTTLAITLSTVIMAIWMGLGQLALLRGGLQKHSTT